jgi:hypothetical protein
MGKIIIELPKGCFNFRNFKRIVAKNIDRNRPFDQTNISTEAVIRHGLRLKSDFVYLKNYIG